jgi:hypothetical protein
MAYFFLVRRIGSDGTVIPCGFVEDGAGKSAYHPNKNCRGNERSSRDCPMRQQQGAALGRASTQANPSRPRRGGLSRPGTRLAPLDAPPPWERNIAAAARAPGSRLAEAVAGAANKPAFMGTLQQKVQLRWVLRPSDEAI